MAPPPWRSLSDGAADPFPLEARTAPGAPCPCPWQGSCCKLLASAQSGLRIPRPLPCPSGSWNQSAHLLRKPLHQRSPGSCCWPPGATGLGLYRIFEIADLCPALPLREPPAAPLPSTEMSPRSGEDRGNPPRAHCHSELTLKKTLSLSLTRNLSRKERRFCVTWERLADLSCVHIVQSPVSAPFAHSPSLWC